MSKLQDLWRRKIVNSLKRFFGAEECVGKEKIKEKSEAGLEQTFNNRLYKNAFKEDPLLLPIAIGAICQVVLLFLEVKQLFLK